MSSSDLLTIPGRMEFSRAQNQVSLLLALARHRLPPSLYRSLLSMRLAADDSDIKSQSTREFCRTWVFQVSQLCSALQVDLERGRPARLRIRELVHLYRDYFIWSSMSARRPERQRITVISTRP